MLKRAVMLALGLGWGLLAGPALAQKSGGTLKL